MITFRRWEVFKPCHVWLLLKFELSQRVSFFGVESLSKDLTAERSPVMVSYKSRKTFDIVRRLTKGHSPH